MAPMMHNLKINFGFLEYKKEALFIKRVVKIGRKETLERRMNTEMEQCYKSQVHNNSLHAHHAHHADHDHHAHLAHHATTCRSHT